MNSVEATYTRTLLASKIDREVRYVLLDSDYEIEGQSHIPVKSAISMPLCRQMAVGLENVWSYTNAQSRQIGFEAINSQLRL
jgi:hypothetical protein